MSLWRFLSFPSATTQETRVIGRKRIAVSDVLEGLDIASPTSSSLCKRRGMGENSFTHLESMPLDLLVKIVCKVYHSDLKNLILLSKSLTQATLIAREVHFQFSTPCSTSTFNRRSVEEHDDTAPPAPSPEQRIPKASLHGGDRLRSVVTVLFPS